MANDSRRERESLSALLERVIDQHGLTQKGLADASGVPLATLNAWISGRRSPRNSADSKEQLRSLAQHLPGVTVAQLFESIGQQVPGEVSPEAEARTLALYRNLSGGRRRVVDQLVETLASEERTTS
ncbi:helix-turn-helix domain-containing protein [Streptomyces camponoticapitis]|uniref:helix-turn-helix domain-containing protein n=1 Tax=Streptomyces camponoticapitis TaxID=1616125 RepID=UPI001666E271|nr:helix-turn-helix transcriptional regulator [Streptomyces camponoticapitis]